jgi:tetratricopeptide (TPR) repeat protein
MANARRSDWPNKTVDSNFTTPHAIQMVESKSGKISFTELESQARLFENEQRLEEARDAFDAALRLNPSSQSCAEGRARVAFQLRDDDAVEHCSRALAFHDDNPDRQLRMIETAAVDLGSAAIPLLEDYIRRNPQKVVAHERLSELRAEEGAGERFIDNYLNALRRHPGSKPLLMSYWNTLSRSGRLVETLDSMESKRSLFEGDRDFVLLEVNIANHAGLADRAGPLLEQLDSNPDANLARGQHRLQTGRPEEAAKLLATVAVAQPNNQSAWALLELAWRMTGDSRHEWLVDQPGLYGISELGLGSVQLADISATLRTLHRARSQPVGQSVRGGTQTAGQLFMRNEPEILLLMEALAVAIRQFVSTLPAADSRHPLLKHRNQGMEFGPSWSVRLCQGGYHAAHFHPNGILSSACYISLPADLANDPDRPGWLELGRPPAELGLDLPPLATIEPKPGRLVLFPSFLFHGTRPFTHGERLTVAFDLIVAV